MSSLPPILWVWGLVLVGCVDLSRPRDPADSAIADRSASEGTASDRAGVEVAVEMGGGGTCRGVDAGPDPLDSCGKYQCRASACLTRCASTGECVSPNVCHDGACGGLKGEYYDDADFAVLKLTRTDPRIDFNWGAGSPDPSIGADTFSIRWTGKVTPRYTQLYTFHVAVDDGVRLWVDGVPVIDSWLVQVGTRTGQVMLMAGRAHELRVDYYEGLNSGQISVAWSSASQSKEVIPASVLSPR